MRTISGLLLIVILNSCEGNGKELLFDNSSNEFRNVTESISTQEFKNIKSFVLENGDIQTYSNMYNNNPHYSFDGFEVYLNPEIQLNINSDPGISDFNEIVIRDLNSDPQYYHVLMVKQGDIENEKIIIPEGMKEDNVYLLKYQDYSLDSMGKSLNEYIRLIRNEVDLHN